jgi:hypothetical protein
VRPIRSCLTFFQTLAVAEQPAEGLALADAIEQPGGELHPV